MHFNVMNALTSYEPLSTSQRKAAIIVVAFALLSTLAFVFLVLRTIWEVTVSLLNHDNWSRPPDVLFFRTQLGHFTACLILSNVFISIAGLINLSWLTHSGLSRGPTCSAQAILMQIGLWGTCWFTIVLGMHTLVSFVFRVHQARWRTAVIISVGWGITFFAASSPMREHIAYGPAGISCNIASAYHKNTFSLRALPIVIGVSMSVVVYVVTFATLHWKQKQSTNSAQKPGGLSPTGQRDNMPEDYYKFISMIIRTMFWFPLAFVLLMSPLGVVYILQYVGRPVPLAPTVFAEACAIMLGLVNVGLLYNTFRVISPLSRAAKFVADTVDTFGHDASCESPITPPFNVNFHPQSEFPSHRSTSYNSTQPFSNHSPSSSLSSIDSRTGLIRTEKVPHELTKNRVASMGLHIIPPAELNQQLYHGPCISPRGDAKCRDADTTFPVVESPLRTIALSPCPPRTFAKDTKPAPRMQDDKRAFERPVTDEGTFGKKHSFMSAFSGFSVVPLTTSPLDVMNKSTALATRLGVPAADIPSPPPLVLSPSQKSDVGAHPLENRLWRPESVDEPNLRHFSSYSYASTGTDMTDDSRYSGEIMHAYKIWPNSQVPQSSDEEDKDINGSFSIDLQRRSEWYRRITTATVWSQASGYAINQSPEEESQEMYWQVIADLLDPRVVSPSHMDGAGMMNKRATVARPVTLRIQPIKGRSVRFSSTLKSDIPDGKPPMVKFASNSSDV